MRPIQQVLQEHPEEDTNTRRLLFAEATRTSSFFFGTRLLYILLLCFRKCPFIKGIDFTTGTMVLFLFFLGGGLRQMEEDRTLSKAWNAVLNATVDGGNPFRTRKWIHDSVQTTVCGYLQGNHHSIASWAVQDFVHPHYCRGSLTSKLVGQTDSCLTLKSFVLAGATHQGMAKGLKAQVPISTDALHGRCQVLSCRNQRQGSLRPLHCVGQGYCLVF